MILEPTLSPRFIVYIRNYLLDNGVDPQPVLDKCGINFQEGEENTPPLPLRQIADLFEAASVATDNSCVGLHTAQNYHYDIHIVSGNEVDQCTAPAANQARCAGHACSESNAVNINHI